MGLQHTRAMFVHAPAGLEVGGLFAVPIHIRQLRARVVLDTRARLGYADALLAYQVGPQSGSPLFDLRQPIHRAWLDGRRVSPTRLRAREVGEGHHATMRVLEVQQVAFSMHTLRLKYGLAQPQSDLGGTYPPVLAASGDQRLRWSFGMGDLFDGRHLEMWFPSNLPFDQFPFELTVTMAGAPDHHTLITNGAVTRTAAHTWHITFPPWFSSLSAMLELRPTDELEHAAAHAVLPGSGRSLTVDVWKPKGRPEDLPQAATRIARMLRANEHVFGSFPADRYTCFFHGAEGGMEYAGATTTSSGALGHEVLHSWFARGVMPASDADGWWDEAFTTYVTSGQPPAPLDFRRPPIQLCSRRPLQRHTDSAAYIEGSRLFGGIAALVGQVSMRKAMRTLFQARARTCLSTAELEEHLVVHTGEVRIVDAFSRFVYGFDDPARGSGVRLDGLWLTTGPDARCWINARISNDPDADMCLHFLLLFSIAPLGADRANPGIGANVAAVACFELAPGRSRTVRLLASSIDPPALGVEVVASVHVRLSHPTGRDVDHAQRTVMRRRVRRLPDAPARALKDWTPA